MFLPVKRVAFQERLVEYMPTPIIEALPDTEVEASSTEEDHKRRREIIEAEDGRSTPVDRRLKRRDWVWSEVLASQDLVSVSVGNETETPPVQIPVDVNMQMQPDPGNGKDDVGVRHSSTPEAEFTM